MLTNKQNLSAKEDIYLICLNPHCNQSKQRCLNGKTIRTHPSQCSKFLYTTQAIIAQNNDISSIADYPNDPLGIAVCRKINSNINTSFLERSIHDFRTKIQKIIDEFYKVLQEIYPISCLEDKFIQMYSLKKLSTALQENASSAYLTKIINNSLAPTKYTQLLMMNQKYDTMVQSLNNICSGVKSSLRQFITKAEQTQTFKKTLPDYFQTKIHYGLVKSKYIGSSKITCQKGVITFPKIENIASFLPWIYSDKPFSTGMHQFKIHSLKFPVVSNCGFSVLQQHNIDTYPYHFFKSFYNKQGRGFTLVQGSQMEFIIGEASTIILTLDLGSHPYAVIHDADGRSKYQCKLTENRSYRVALYGCGWAAQVLELY